MRASRNKSSHTPLLLVVAFLTVLGLAAGAFLLLDDDAPQQSEPAAVVSTPSTESAEPMELPAQPVASTGAIPIEVPDRETTGRTEAIFVAEAGTPVSNITGRVLDDDDQPIAGCEVRIFKGNALLLNVNLVGSRRILPMRALSAADGSFTLNAVPVGKDYVLVGEHEGFATSELLGLTVQPKRDLDQVVLRMNMGAVLSGMVVSAVGGGPISGARVELFDAIASVQLDPAERRPWKIVFTDNAGNYAFEHVSATSLKVRVQSATFESQSRMVSFALEAKAVDHTVNFALKEGRSLPGQVIDDLGRAVTGARIEATSLTKDYQGTAIANSDANGFFVLDGMGTDQHYQVRTVAKGYSNKMTPKVHIDDGNLLIEMERRLFVEGWVRDTQGVPIPSFTLTLMRSAQGRDPIFLNDVRSFSANDGHFVFDNLDPGHYTLEANAKGFAPHWSESFRVARTDEPAPQVSISLGPGGELTGTVYDSTGATVKGAVIKLHPNKYVESPVQGIFAALGQTQRQGIRTRSNPKGVFKISNIRSGTYQIACSHPGSAPIRLNDILIVDEASGSNPPITVVLPAGATIGGIAMDENTRVIPFCEVQITNKKTAYLDAVTTDSRGRFLFNNLAEGNYTLMLKPDRMNNETVNPLMKLMTAQRSMMEVFVTTGQSLTDVQIYLQAM
jgi:uncharacterized GH25 family protein